MRPHHAGRPAMAIPGKASGCAEVAIAADCESVAWVHGVTNYYSGYVPRYAELAAPLSTKLCVNREDGKKGSRKQVSWKDRDVRVFEEMKRAVTGKLELFRLDPDKPFLLRADASDRAIGAVLEQTHEQGIGPFGTVPVGFFSRNLSKHQLNRTPQEKETYAVVEALKVGGVDRPPASCGHDGPQVGGGLGSREDGQTVGASGAEDPLARGVVQIRLVGAICPGKGQRGCGRDVEVRVPGLQDVPGRQHAWECRGARGREKNHRARACRSPHVGHDSADCGRGNLLPAYHVGMWYRVKVARVAT